MKEVLDVIIFSQKADNKEHGEGWQKGTETLNTIEQFQVTGQGVRDRILTLQRKQKGKLNKGRSVTGLGEEEPPEFELLIKRKFLRLNLYMR